MLRRGQLYAIAIVILLTSGGMSLAAAPHERAAVNATTASRGAAEEEGELGPLSTAEKQGYGCLVAGGGSLLLTGLAGTNEMVLVMAGGSVPPSTAVGLGLAVTGTIFASACAVGALVAPTALRLWRYYYEGWTIVDTPR